MESKDTGTSDHLLAVLVTLMGAGPLFMLSLSSTSAVVVERFDITAAQLGFIAAIVFGSAAVVARPMGRWADIMPPVWQLLLNFGGAALSLLIAAMTSNYAFLCLAAVLAGTSQAISNPTTNRLVFESVGPAKRAAWLGIKQSGVPVAQLFGGAFFPLMVVWVGWTGSALAGAAIVVFLIIYGLLVLKFCYRGQGSVSRRYSSGDERPRRSVPVEADSPVKGSVPVVGLLTVISFFSAFSLQSLNVYIPLFAVEQMGFTLVQGGLAITAGGIVGMVARVWWARRAGSGDRLSTLLLVIIAGSVLSAALLLLAQVSGTGLLVWPAVLLHGGTALGTMVIINAGVMRAVLPSHIGKASGVAAMGMYAGFAVGPVIIGWVRDLGSDFTFSWAVAICAYLLAAPFVLILRFRGFASPGEVHRW